MNNKYRRNTEKFEELFTMITNFVFQYFFSISLNTFL